jgi:hypothetical protein
MCARGGLVVMSTVVMVVGRSSGIEVTEVKGRHPAATPPMGFNHCNVGCGKTEWNASAQMAMADAMVSR